MGQGSGPGREQPGVCNFSRKYLWRMALTRCRQPQEVLVAGPEGRRGDCGASVLLHSTERWRDTARRPGSKPGGKADKEKTKNCRGPAEAE